MLDVHPPHQAAHTWKDFFIHIATIVIGLLIAVGLEQTVEAIHHRREVTEAREALRVERDANCGAFAAVVREFYRQNTALENNLMVLHYLEQHPHASSSVLPGVLVWHARSSTLSDSAWRTAQQSNVTALMPQNEVRRNASFYERIAAVNRLGFDQIWPAVIEARIFFADHPDLTALTPEQIEEGIKLTLAVKAALFVHAAALVQLSELDAGFEPAITPAELNQLMQVDALAQNPAYAAAVARTRERVPELLPLPGSQR